MLIQFRARLGTPRDLLTRAQVCGDQRAVSLSADGGCTWQHAGDLGEVMASWPELLQARPDIRREGRDQMRVTYSINVSAAAIRRHLASRETRPPHTLREELILANLDWLPS